MKYFSSRNKNLTCSGAEAIVNGIAPDGGLYLPETFRLLDLTGLADWDDNRLAVKVLGNLFEDFTEEELSAAIHGAYDKNFDDGRTAPLKQVGDRYIMELWHGPTAAFKDVALCLLPRLLRMSADKCGVSDEICILTATSGDTGGAALSGFCDAPGTRIGVFYPNGGVSPAQERQMTSCPGKNAFAASVVGNFDDTQTGVKTIFATVTPPAGVRFSSANSINIGRLAPQIVYYFQAYRDLLQAGRIRFGEPVDFVVPTGNFGDILSGYFAKQMGLPVGRLVCASNKNNVLTDFFTTGEYDRNRHFYLTASPSMDILISSNLERLICMKVGTEQTAAYMQELKQTGRYRLAGEVMASLREEFAADWTGEEETLGAIRRVYEQYHYLIDTHTAVAYAVAEKYQAEGGRPVVVLSTASPFKFANNVLKAIGEEPAGDEFATMEKLSRVTGVTLPASLAGLMQRPVIHRHKLEKEEMAQFVLDFVKKPL